jgi:tRNA dimethylallyltransferase
MNKVIILLGPTGVGKTGVSLLLAKNLKTEIISADSMQIYRNMDIGTAKASPAERKCVTHHMIDVAEPWEMFSTGKYIAAIKPIIEYLLMQGKIPIVVGGTGLYIRAMTRGIFSGPSADWTLREELLTIEQEGRGTLYDSLKILDPVAVEKITPNDTRRLIRALEVCFKGRSKISELQKRLTRPLPYDFIKIGITRKREELYRLIEERVDKMIEAGLIEEVKTVMNLMSEHAQIQAAARKKQDEKNQVSTIREHEYSTLPSFQAIGYKEIVRHLRGEFGLSEAINLIKKASKRYAKRQFTWFRKEEDIRWVDITGITDPHEVLCKINPVLEKLSTS